MLLQPAGLRKPCRSCTAPLDWTTDIQSSEVRSDAFGSGRLGVSETELIDQLDAVIADIQGPVCIVRRHDVSALNKWVTHRLGPNAPVAPVTADRLKDVVGWVQKQTSPVTVLVYLSLWDRSTQPSQLVVLRETMAEGSRLVFIEPTLGVGVGSVFQRFAKRMLKRRIGLSFDRDIPAMVRHAGWQLTTINRFSVGAPASVLTFVVGEARIYGSQRESLH